MEERVAKTESELNSLQEEEIKHQDEADLVYINNREDKQCAIKTTTALNVSHLTYNSVCQHLTLTCRWHFIHASWGHSTKYSTKQQAHNLFDVAWGQRWKRGQPNCHIHFYTANQFSKSKVILYSGSCGGKNKFTVSAMILTLLAMFPAGTNRPKVYGQ